MTPESTASAVAPHADQATDPATPQPTPQPAPQPTPQPPPQPVAQPELPVQDAAGEIKLPPPLRADSSLDQAIAAFDEYMKRKGFRDNTVKAFRNDLKIAAGFLNGNTRLHEITTRYLEDFLYWMQHDRGTECKPKTLARRITTLKVFFSWLHGVGVIASDPAEPIVQLAARTPLPQILRDEDVSRLRLAAQDLLIDRKHPDARPCLLVNLLLQTGIKKSECANLRISDIETDDPQSPAVTIRYEDARYAHKQRRLSLHPNLLAILRQYLDQYTPKQDVFECTPRNLEYVLDEVGKAAGIRKPQVGFETLRWTAAVRDFKHGMPEERLREKMGLSKISWRETREKIYLLTGRGEPIVS
jgi:integrase/recombinase XerD